MNAALAFPNAYALTNFINTLQNKNVEYSMQYKQDTININLLIEDATRVFAEMSNEFLKNYSKKLWFNKNNYLFEHLMINKENKFVTLDCDDDVLFDKDHMISIEHAINEHFKDYINPHGDEPLYTVTYGDHEFLFRLHVQRSELLTENIIVYGHNFNITLVPHVSTQRIPIGY